MKAALLALVLLLAGCGEDCPAPVADEEWQPDPFANAANAVVYDENDCAYLVQLGESLGSSRRPIRWGGRLSAFDRHPQTGPKENCVALIRR